MDDATTILATAIARARELVHPIRDEPGFVGAFLGGSVTRGTTDALSDLDLYTVYDDAAFAKLSAFQRLRMHFTNEGGVRRKDYEIFAFAWSVFTTLPDSTWDVDHSQWQYNVLLADPYGCMRPLIDAIRELPESVRRDRIEVHYVEFHHYVGKSDKCLLRGQRMGALLTGARAVWAMVKCLFLARGYWVPKNDFVMGEMQRFGFAAALIAKLEECLSAPSAALFVELGAALDEELAPAHVPVKGKLMAINFKMFFDPPSREMFRHWAEAR